MTDADPLIVRDSGFSRTLVLAGIAGASGVMIGAFGAHYLGPVLASQYDTVELVAKRTSQFDTGARYHLIHALALLGLAALQKNMAPGQPGARLVSIAAILVVVGIVLFSGSLYALVLSGQTWLGAITPLGGTSWIIAWSLIAAVGWQSRR